MACLPKRTSCCLHHAGRLHAAHGGYLPPGALPTLVEPVFRCCWCGRYCGMDAQTIPAKDIATVAALYVDIPPSPPPPEEIPPCI